MTKFTLDNFIAWLETKDPNEHYVWGDSSRCAAAQFSASIGHIYNPKDYWTNPEATLIEKASIRGYLNNRNSLPRTTTGTFGIALEAARELKRLRRNNQGVIHPPGANIILSYSNPEGNSHG